MSIDWLTVIAQIINFLVLIWLLKRFLYRPILAGIDAREAEIAKRIAAADQAKTEALAAKQKYQDEYAAHLSERESLVEIALKNTEAERTKLIQEGRQQLQQEQENWQHFFAQEKQLFFKQLSQNASHTLYELMRKALHELADAELENAIARHLLTKLDAMQQELSQAGGSSPNVEVISTWPLSEATQTQLSTHLKQQLPQAQVRFEHNDNQSVGIELRLGGAQVSWSLDSYLDSLKEHLEHHG